MSTKYDYRDAVTVDIVQFLLDNPELINDPDLEDYIFNDDGVTGNASGSYTCRRFLAKEYISQNLDLLSDALSDMLFDEFFTNEDDSVAGRIISKNWEWFDVIIRCYLVPECLPKAIEMLKEQHPRFYKEATKNDKG